MADPTKYTPGYDFSDYQTTNPKTPLPGTRLDDELASIAQKLGGVVDAIKEIRRSDAALKNGIVTKDSLAGSLLPTLGQDVDYIAGLVTQFGDVAGAVEATQEIRDQTEEIGQQKVDAAEALRALVAADRVQTGLDRSQSTTANLNATAEANRAEVAKNIAFTNADVYSSVNAALSDGGLATGKQFQVTFGAVAVRYRKDSSTTATELASYPTADGVNDGLLGQFIYTGTGSRQVTRTDLLGNILSYTENNKVYNEVDPADPTFRAAFDAGVADSEMYAYFLYTGSDGVLMSDLQGNVLVQASDTLRTVVNPPIPLKASQLLNGRRQRTGTHIGGQSLSVGLNSSGIFLLISTSQPYSNMTFGSGPSSSKPGSVGSNSSPGTTTFMPLVETGTTAQGDAGGETPVSGTCNFAVERALRRGSVIDPAKYVNYGWTSGHGGYSIAQLTNDAWFQLARDQIDAFVAKCVADGVTFSIPALFFVQGNNDVTAGTGRAGYIAAAKTYRTKLENYILSKIPDNGPVAMVYVQTEYETATDPGVAMAQVDLAKTEQHFYFCGPTFHMAHVPTESHLTAAGYKHLGCYFGRAKQQLELEDVRPEYLEPLSATYTGGRVVFKWRVPCEPLVIDQAVGGVTTQYGLALKDSSGLIPLSDIRVSANDEISALPARVPLAGATGRIGLDFKGANITLGSARTHNIRDSTPETAVINGVTTPLYHVSPIYELPLIFPQG